MRGPFVSLHWLIAGLVVLTGWGIAHAVETIQDTDPNTGGDTWEMRAGGVYLRLAQILPDQVRGFYSARGFDPASVEAIAQACVFQTILRNEAAPGAIHFNLGNWRARTAKGDRPMKLVRDWDKEWEQRRVPSAARTAFYWALFPTEHTYEVGDWNMGMLTIALPLGSRFDLRFAWEVAGTRHEARLRDVQCATDSKTRVGE